MLRKCWFLVSLNTRLKIFIMSSYIFTVTCLDEILDVDMRVCRQLYFRLLVRSLLVEEEEVEDTIFTFPVRNNIMCLTT